MAIETPDDVPVSFHSTHFEFPTPEHILKISNEAAAILEPQNPDDEPPILYVLNQISCDIAETCPDEDSIVFMPVDSTMPHHPNDYRGPPPPIVAIKHSVYLQLKKAKITTPSWHHVLSVIEPYETPNITAHAEACGTFLALLMQARPDMISFYGVALPPKSFESDSDKWSAADFYELRCSTAAGLDRQAYYPNDLVPLTAYVEKLYGGHASGMYDTSVVLERPISIRSAPRWEVYFGPGKSYRDCEVVVVGWPWHRMTWIAKTIAPNGNPILIKDAFRRYRGIFVEGEFYDVLHDRDEEERDMKYGDERQRYTYNRDVPGFCILLASLDVPQPGSHDPIKVGRGRDRRLKTRLVMSTSGDSLNKCKTAVTFAKCMYDAVQAHRYAVEHLNILHRDVSFSNIIINPKEARDPRIMDTPDRPKFITEILDPTKKFAAPLSRLIDLDGATELDASKATTRKFKRFIYYKNSLRDQPDQQKEYTKHLRYCSGTPGFISRGNCNEGHQSPGYKLEPMPELEGRAQKLYQAQYSRKFDPLRFHVDRPDGKCPIIHGCKPGHPPSVFIGADWVQRPRDDVESMFWCIIWFYLRAAPREETVVEKNLEEDRRLDLELYNLVDSIRSHSFDGLDRRVSILDTSKDAWANQFLHPKLAFVAPLLVELAEQIRPDYRRLKPAPDPVHLHEAVSRILLKYIVQWEDDGCDVELDTERRRDVSRADAQREKRKASEEAEDSRGKRHRQD